jgi:hypothetical protein
MSTVDVKFDKSILLGKINDLKKVTAQAMPLIYAEYVKNTPVAPVNGGNARNNTKYHSNIITADYEYASVLDAGRGFRDGQMRGSEQAPKGMSDPTKIFAQKLIPQLVKKIGSKR